MSSLREKLERLNRLHIRNKLGKKGDRDNGPVPIKNLTPAKPKKFCTLDTSKWGGVQEDTSTFNRGEGKEKSTRLELSIPCLRKEWKKEKDFFRIKRHMHTFWTRSKTFDSLFYKTLSEKENPFEIFGLGSGPETWCFLDLETCGFSGSNVFLIGAGYFKDGGFHLDQFFARDYDEEAAIVQGFWSLFESFDTLITFNGKSFDWPFLEERSFVHKLPPRPPQYHLDIFHFARRHWKGCLPNYKLQTLEEIFCRRSRVGDLPGRLIPQAYHDFVAEPDLPSQMVAAVHHNALDIITMAELMLVVISQESCIGKY
ncbi:MAG: ribonuclease H-like domain-containing protein [Fibrobacteria bacterium]|nr:ribonuclease H-like domain-containing protein [Fibrobacteria bacterium]